MEKSKVDLTKLAVNLKTDFKNLFSSYKKFDKINESINKDIDFYNEKAVFPEPSRIFAAFNYVNIKDIKIVIIGQDPYHTYGVADGLAFSTKLGKRIPPSLANIYKEIRREYPEMDGKLDGNLSNWAEQGVLLMNTALTVRGGEPNSHSKLWSEFTDFVIREISRIKSEEGLIFFLWGNFAKSKARLIHKGCHVLSSGHPSPLSVRFFENNGHFKEANRILESQGKTTIKWI